MVFDRNKLSGIYETDNNLAGAHVCMLGGFETEKWMPPLKSTNLNSSFATEIHFYRTIKCFPKVTFHINPS